MRILALLLALAAGAAFAQTAQKPDSAPPAKPAPAAAAPSAGAGATAASGGTASASLFSQLDRNRDGYLDKDELDSQPARRGNWVAVDRDGDGRISRSEFRAIER